MTKTKSASCRAPLRALGLGALLLGLAPAARAVTCSTETYVNSGGAPGNYATITAALAGLPSVLNGPACVEIENNATYYEQVQVQNFFLNASSASVTIMALSTAAATVSPPPGSIAGFWIENSSVNVSGINVVSTGTVSYGVLIENPYVSLSSVNVEDSGGHFSVAGVSASSYTTISNSAVVVAGAGASAIWMAGTFANLSNVAASAASASGGALYMIGATNATISQSQFTNAAGTGVSLNGYSNQNTFSNCTISGSNAGYMGLVLNNSVNNTFSSCFIGNSAGTAVSLNAGSNDDTISFSTITSNAPGFSALVLNGALYGAFTGDYIQGSTAAWILDSTGTAISASVLVATNTTGNALVMTQGSFGLTLTGSVVTARAGGAAVFLGAGDAGAIILATNTFSGAEYGVYAATPAAGAQIWITSNTIVSTMTILNNTYGLYFNGLTSGATIENNEIVYRSPGSMGARTAYGIYALGSIGLQIDHNRIDEPGMIIGGAFVGVDFVETKMTAFKFNDVHSTGTALTNAFLFTASSASVNLVVKDNIFSSSFTATGSSGTITVDATSESGFSANYNDYFSSNIAMGFVWGGVGYQGLAAWQAATAQDENTLSTNPLWAGVGVGVEDFHPRSTAGRWNPTTQALSYVDAAESPTIDAGDPSEAYSKEPSPNGGIANQGSYGDTTQASESQSNYSGCTITRAVGAGQAYPTIASALSSLPNFLPAGKSCVVIEDNGTYAEQVIVQNFTMTVGASLAILAPAGNVPAVDPPAGSAAAFVLAQSSVSVSGIGVAPTHSISYGVLVSSPYVTLSQLTIQDPGSAIAAAAVSATSATTISGLNVAEYGANAAGLLLTGSFTTVTGSTVTADSPLKYALWLDGASVNTFSQSDFTNQLGNAVYLSGASTNTFVQSMMTASSPTMNALLLSAASGNVFSYSEITNSSGTSASLTAGSDANQITFSTITNYPASYPALVLNNVSSNTLTWDTIYDGGESLTAASSNTISLSRIGTLIFASTANSNLITQCTIGGVQLSGNSNFNTISISTTGPLSLNGVSGTYLNDDYTEGSGTAAYVSDSTNTVITGSTLFAVSPVIPFYVGYALLMDQGSANLTVTNSWLTASAAGIVLSTGDSGAITLASDTVTGARYGLLADAEAPGGSISITSMTFANLTAGSTALDLIAGTVVSTFTTVSFDASVGANVSAAGLTGASSITMAAPSGSKTGPTYSNDPSHYVHWPVAPFAVVTFPAAQFVNSLPSISGTAAAFGGATVSSVAVAIEQLSNGLYWNGASSFSSPNPVFILASTPTAATWSYANPTLSNFALANGNAYSIQAAATDSNGLQGIGPVAEFTYETSTPAVFISTPPLGAFVTNLPVVAGMSFDSISGISTVAVQFSSGPGFSTCWNGSAWGGCPDYLPAVGTGTWSFNTGPLNAALMPGALYQITAEATNLANVNGVASSTFVFNAGGSTPNCAVTNQVLPGNTIQSAVNSVPSNMTGNYCILVASGTYYEQVRIQNIATNGYTITIASTPGGPVLVDPPAGSAAAFVIANASVSLMGIGVAPTNPISYGVEVSSSFVNIFQSGIVDPYGLIGTAGIVSSYGSMLAVVNSTVIVTNGAAVGLALNGVVNASAVGDYFQGSPAVSLSSSAASVASSVMISTNGGVGLVVGGSASSVTLQSDSIAGGPFGTGVVLSPFTGSISLSSDTISGSRVGLGIAAQSGFAFLGVNGLNFSQLYPGATAVVFAGGQFVSTFTAAGFDSSVGINVNASALASGSSLTMLAPLGPRSGPLFSADPGHYVHWPTAIPQAWTSPATTYALNTFIATATLTTAASQPIQGRTVYFGYMGSNQSAVTNAIGYATVNFAAGSSSGTYAYTATFVGDSSFTFASSTAPVNVVPRPTSLVLSVATSAVAGTVVAATAALTDAMTETPLYAQNVVFSVAGASQTSVTNAVGVASAAFTAPGSASIYPYFASFPGGAVYAASLVQSTLTVTAQPGPPTSGITSPNAPLQNASLANIAGTAQASPGTSIVYVNVSIQNLANGAYWNGAAFTAASQVFLPSNVTTYSSSATWVYPVSTLLGALASGTSYQIQSQAKDSLSDPQAAASTFVFSYDAVYPAVAVLTPQPYTSYAALSVIGGTAYDGAGISTVTLSVSSTGTVAGQIGCFSPAANAFNAVCPSTFAAQGSTAAWSYSGIPWVAGQAYNLTATAIDPYGNAAPGISNGFRVLGAPPVSAITGPNAPYLNAPPTVVGTAQAYSGAGVSFVGVSIQNTTSGLYWNGSSFSANAPVYSPATFLSVLPSSVSWSYAVPAAVLTSSGAYQIQSQAKDTNAQVQTAASAPYDFSFDNVQPVVSIVSPAANTAYANLSFVSGTAFDGAGLSTVTLSISSTGTAAGLPGCFNPAANAFNAICPSTFSAQGSTAAWSFSAIPWVPGQLYNLSATAIDPYGNFATAVSNGFRVLGAAPVSAITAPNAPYLNAPPAVMGTAQAYAGAGVSAVGVSIEYTASGLYWNGSSFSASTPVFTPATFLSVQPSSVAWSYVVPAAALQSTGAYQIQSQATDTNGQPQNAAGAPYSFSFDNIQPTIVIQVPVSSGVYTSTAIISGASWDIVTATVALRISQVGGGCFSPASGNFNGVCTSTFPAQGTPAAWSYAGVPWASGQQYIVYATIVDIYGNSASYSSAFNTTAPSGSGTPPVSTITGPNAPYLNAPPTIVGTAQAFSGAAVSGVGVSIENTATGLYWNGVSFSVSTPAFSPAAFVAIFHSSVAWSYAVPAVALSTAGAYQIQSQATDTNAQVQIATGAAYSFSFDNVQPTVSILAPLANAAYASLPIVSGTSSDAAGVSAVLLSVGLAGTAAGQPGCYSPTSNAFNAVCPSTFAAHGSTTVWSYSGIPWVPGQAYNLSATAIDPFGNSATSASNGFRVLGAAPVSAITGPSAPYVNAPPVVTGTAQAFAGAGVGGVGVSIESTATGLYWNGTSFSASVPTFNPAAIIAVFPSSAAWSYAVPAAALSTGAYQVQSQATDTNGQIQVGTGAPYDFSFDNVQPLVSILTPLPNTAYAGLPAISGTSYDGAGVTAVILSVAQSPQAGSGTGLGQAVCYSPASNAFNAVCPSTFSAHGSTSAWSYAGIPWVPGQTYNLSATALDLFGNAGTNASNGFRVLGAAPVSAITGPNASRLNAPPTIVGTAQAFAGAGVSVVGVSIENSATGLYWTGLSFSSSTPFFSPANFLSVQPSSVAWSYPVPAVALSSAGSYLIQSQATDTNGQVQISTAAPYVFSFDDIPPGLAIIAPSQGAVYSSLPAVSGTSTDGAGVSTVTLNIAQAGGGCFSPALGSFNAICPSSFPALGTPAAWSYPGIPWASGQQYILSATAVDAFGNATTASNGFNFFVSTGLGVGVPGDGQGSATLSPTTAAGCQLVAATATFTAGPAGISAGGAIALSVPNGWTQPQGSAPAQPGYVQVLSTGGYSLQFTASANAGAVGSNATAAAAVNTIVYNVTTALSPGQVVFFFYDGYPGQGASAQGPQIFSFESRGGGNGHLVAISSSPAMTVTPGAPALLSFVPSGALTLGVGQNSPPMQVQLLDACNAATQTPTPLSISLGAVVNGGVDASAVFYSTSGTTLASAAVPGGYGLSQPFYFNTSTAGANAESLLASAVLGGSPANVARAVNLLPAPAAINAVSVDNGALGTAQSTTIVSNSSIAASAFINFTLSNPTLPWQVLISSVAGTFSPAVANFTGTGNPGRTLTWNGTDLLTNPSPFLPPGVYYVEIIAGQGSAVNTSLSITIAPSPSIYGVLLGGNGVTVSAVGPNSGPGTFAVAGTTGTPGFFQIFGLQNGGVYRIQASTSVVVSSSVLTLTASTSAIAALGGSNAGFLSFQAPSQLDVAASLPFPAPSELFGTVSVHNSSYTQTGSGTLHFAAGSSASDNGAQSFGSTASTFTVIALPPGTYEVDVALPGLGISTAVAGVVVNGGGPTVLPIALQKLANVYGYAILPSTVAVNTGITVQAQSLTNPNLPTILGSVAVPVSASSGIFSLYGLSPGTWTVTAVSPGALPAVSTVVIGAFDVGTPAGGGFNLSLRPAGILFGVVFVAGNTSQSNLSASCPNGAALCVPVTVYSPTSFYNGTVTVVLATSTTQTASSFTLTGLPDGLYFLGAQLNGYVSAGQTANVVGGFGAASLSLTPAGAQLSVIVNLPAGTHPQSDFKNVSLGFAGTHGETQYYADMTAGTTAQYFASSATVQFAALNPDSYQFQAYYASDGMYRAASASLATNATAAVLLDLSGPTYPVGGTFSLAANLSLPNSAGQSVVVSSVPGLISNTPYLNYCLLGYASPPSISAAHLELLPVSATGGVASAPLQTSGCPAGTNLISPLNAADTGAQLPNPYLAYVATIGVNGSFAFPDVPPGVYELRNNAVIDAAGDQIPQFTQTVIVTGTVSGLLFQIGSGASVSGSVLAPAGTVLTRSMTVELANAQGQVAASAQVVFNNSASAAFSFPQVVNGAYTLLLADSSYPKAYAAAPLPVTVAGLNLSGQNLQAAQSGTIEGHIAVQENLNGTPQLMLISAVNANLLPASLQIQALSAQGAMGYASGPNGGVTPVLNGNGEFVVDGLLPGTYGLLFTAPGAAGSVALVNTSIPGVVVQAGSVTDIGTANLIVGSQLSGRITNSSTGQALANIAVAALPSLRGSGVTAAGAQGLTDGNGRYVLNGLDPTVRYYDVYAAFRGSEQQGETLPPYQQTIFPAVDVTTVSVLNVAVAPAPASVFGQVAAPPGGPSLGVPLLANGLSLPGALVYLQPSGVIPLRNPIADIQFQTDINGNFTIPSLTTGTYVLTATSLGYSALSRIVNVVSTSAYAGILTMTQAGTLSGTLTNADGTYPSVTGVSQILAATSDQSSVLTGALTINPNTQTVSAYSISGFKPGLAYHVIIVDSQNDIVAPPEASNVVLTSTAGATINIVYRPTAPLAAANASRQGQGFLISFVLSQPLRNLTPSDNNYAAILTTVSAQGTLSQFALSQDRTILTAFYLPGVAESSFTLRCSGYSTIVNPNSTDPVNNQFPIVSTVTFFLGIDGLGQTNVPNLNGGDVFVSGNNGRVTLPPASFSVGASSSVLVTLQVAEAPLTGGSGASVQGVGTAAAARLASLRYGTQAYPSEVLAAAAAVPPTVNPLSAFYNIFLPLGVSTALSKPAQLTLAYSTGTDPSTLNLYWYNPAANNYVLTQDVTGAQPVINTANNTITLNVNHFSTYVLFNSAQAVITGSTGAGALEADNFPNPFDLGPKTVSPLHASGTCSPSCVINGTMIGVSVPPGASGDATIRIFNLAGTRVRSFDLGSLQGGTFYYQNWDGTNDSGKPVASGAYIGELRIGSQKSFFRMALIKGSGL